ncbi:MAG TPA: AtpZ/AtpI family protein [Kofleriaceae bacterium]|nr:AtpZ/AtpI family protein [Kofleriaceae bacterium]
MIRTLQNSEMSQESAAKKAVDPYARKTRGMYQTLSMSSVGLEMGLCVIIGLFFGRWLDGKIGSDPAFMIVFLLVGFAAGMKGVMRAVAAADRIAVENEQFAAEEAVRIERETARISAGSRHVSS